jgi:RND family efflux transporter MFP subunit
MSPNIRWILWTAALAALVTLPGCGSEKSATAKPGEGAPADTALLAAADVAVVTTADLAAGIPVSGTLAPGARVRVTSPLDDIVAEVLVREGQRVTKGQVLGRFRQASVVADAASSRAALASATADRERQKNLLAEGAVSERDVESAEAAYRAARAQDELVQRRLLDATLRAPFAGTLTTRSVQSGDRVGKGDPLFVVADTRELEFEATVPGDAISQVRVGAPVTLTVSGFAPGAITGHVARINATADPATRQVKVYATVANADGRLVGDLFASGTILTEQAVRAIAAPPAGVRRDGDGEFAWVIGTDGRAVRRTIRSGVRDEARDLVQVISGLAARERVIVGPVEGLSAGQAVHVAGKER